LEKYGMTADFTEIIRLAALSNKNLTGKQWTNFQRDLVKLGPQRVTLAIFARVLLAGRPVEVEMLGNNPQPPDLIDRYRSLADYLGATLEEVVDGPFSTSMIFFPHPPARH
jgi:hypothetical protein